jgi:lambda repressor-like predicted transcriptional regulator
MQSLPEQLLAAMKTRGWSVSHLLKVSQLTCDRTSLHRKLHGKQPLVTDEVHALVNALGITVVAMPDEADS